MQMFRRRGVSPVQLVKRQAHGLITGIAGVLFGMSAAINSSWAADDPPAWATSGSNVVQEAESGFMMIFTAAAVLIFAVGVIGGYFKEKGVAGAIKGGVAALILILLVAAGGLFVQWAISAMDTASSG